MDEVRRIVSNLNAPPKKYNAEGYLTNSNRSNYSEPLFAVRTWDSLSEKQQQDIVDKYTTLIQSGTDNATAIQYIRGRLITLKNQPESELKPEPVQVTVPVRSGNTQVRIPQVHCTPLTSTQIASLLWDHSTINLSYGSPIHCHLLNKLGVRGPLGSIEWDDFENILPKKDYTAGIKTIDLTNQRLTSPQFLVFIVSLKNKYPTFNPSTIIVDGNLEGPEFLEPLQYSVQKRLPGVTLVLNKKGGSKKMTRHRRGTRKAKWRKSNRNRRFH